jgi:hypothetical protein
MAIDGEAEESARAGQSATASTTLCPNRNIKRFVSLALKGAEYVTQKNLCLSSYRLRPKIKSSEVKISFCRVPLPGLLVRLFWPFSLDTINIRECLLLYDS